VNRPAQTAVRAKAPSDSFCCVELPLKSDAELRDQYVSWRGSLRFAKILEDLDAFAGNVAFLHADDNNPATRAHTLVTAAVDRIDCRKPLVAGVDYLLTGNVSWTGRSSMRVSLSVGEKPKASGSTKSLGASTTRP